MADKINIARPFLKWAGGKTQLLSEISELIPKKITDNQFTYIEPFVGSGAVLFWILEQYPNIQRAIINDINEDLINTYKTIQQSPQKLINILKQYQEEYHSLVDKPEQKKDFYYKKRELYNARSVDVVTQSALFIFLNRTCFNGLYRVNKKNEFNVPIGSYKKPTICDAENILSVHQALQKVVILHGDFEQTLVYAEKNSLFYLDPPYKPLNDTSSFNSYAKDEFNDDEQIRLRDFCSRLNNLNYYWILSNSDVKGADPQNDFFDDLYTKFNIQRVQARRNINANSNKRGFLTELLITN